MRAWLVLGLVLLAGCAEEVAEDPVETTDPEPIAVAQVPVDVAPPAAPDADDWYELRLTATPAGQVAAYQFEIPNGTDVPAWYDADRRVRILEIMPLNGTPLDAFYVGGFVQGDAIFESYGASGLNSGLGLNEHSFGGVSSQGTYLYIAGVDAGQNMTLVLAAQGAGDAAFGVRFLETDPWAGQQYDRPSESASEFKAAADIGWTLRPVGEAQGFFVDVFEDYHSTITPHQFRHVIGDMAVEELTPNTPVRPVASLTASVEGAGGPGYTSTAMLVWNQVHAGIVTVDLQARDAAPIQGTYPLEPDPIVSSTIALLRGDGDGASSASLTYQAAGVSTSFPELLFVSHVGFDVTLEELAGIQVDDGGRTYGALPIYRTDGGLHMWAGDSFLSLPGLELA